MRCRRNGGFPKSLYYDSYDDKIVYTSSVINQIFEKDIKTSTKIKDRALFERIEKYVINNFEAVISAKSIYEYLQTKEKMNVDRRTIKRYIDVLEKAKIIYSCELFDIKSKMVLKGEKKYYLADLSIYLQWICHYKKGMRLITLILLILYIIIGSYIINKKMNFDGFIFYLCNNII